MIGVLRLVTGQKCTTPGRGHKKNRVALVQVHLETDALKMLIAYNL